MAGRVGVRNTLAAFISNPPITNLNQVFTSFPKRINYQVNSQPGQLTRSAAIVFIAAETENRLAIGGATNGWKRVDYTIVLQVYTHSMQRNAEDVMNDFDELIDNIKTRLRSDHTFGDPVDAFDEVEKKIAEKMGFRASSDDRYKLLEMHVDIDLPGYEDTDDDGEPTGIALPYVVTIEKGTQTVLAIRRNWNPDDDTKQKRNHFVHYSYIPGFGFYAFGLIHLPHL